MSQLQPTIHSHGLTGAAVKLIRTHRTALAEGFNTDGAWTSREVSISTRKLTKFRNYGIVRAVGEEQKRAGWTRTQYRLTADAQTVLTSYLEADAQRETICPCSCPQGGVKNLRDGGFACPECGTEFTRSELRE